MRFSMRRRFSIPRKRGGFQHRFALYFIVFIILLLLSFIFVDKRIRPTLFQLAEAKARVMATSAINEAIQSKVSQNLHYEDLIAVKVDNRGRVVLIQPNTGEINRLASQAVIEVQKKLHRVSTIKVKIPLGQVFGTQVLGGVGPSIPVTIMPVGTVGSRVFDEFEQAGINQTRHKLYLEVKVQVKIIVPLTSSHVLVKAEVPLTEAIIMGEVPQVYFGGNPNVSLPQMALPETKP
ncbi:MAG TPA: sporulation protein YunB [Bacillota bacterium]|nr:sporulation protein YunB [Bacillota bacterium]